MRFYLLLIISFSLLLTGCGSMKSQPKSTLAQIQSMQTRQFHVSKRKLYEAVIQVFQDNGFVIKHSDYETGFMTAKGLSKSDDYGLFGDIVDSILWGSAGDDDSVHTTYTVCSALMTPIHANTTQVRINCVGVRKTSIGDGIGETDNQVKSPKAYEHLFNKIKTKLIR
ncbi:MAG: hypothetical protein KKH06_04870 [Gammaproteobacteria bacterium]|nr:hypothetical protein [Gammaproteobacteria bacterium]